MRFMQDGASPHRALTTVAWLNRKRVRRLNGGVWPPQSPDLNPIEHVWPIVLRTLSGQVFAGKEDLWVALQSAFAAVPVADIKRLYASMPRRIEAVIAAHGGHTRY